MPHKGKAEKPTKVLTSKTPQTTTRAKKPAKTLTKRPQSDAPASGPIRMVLPHEIYSPNKDAIKAPIKELQLKWQSLGEKRGRWSAPGVSVFLQADEEKVDLTLSGDDAKKVAVIKTAWAPWLTAESTGKAVERAEQKEASESLAIWEIGKPVRQPGEPESFFERRLAEWKEKDPRKS